MDYSAKAHLSPNNVIFPALTYACVKTLKTAPQQIIADMKGGFLAKSFICAILQQENWNIIEIAQYMKRSRFFVQIHFDAHNNKLDTDRKYRNLFKKFTRRYETYKFLNS